VKDLSISAAAAALKALCPEQKSRKGGVTTLARWWA